MIVDTSALFVLLHHEAEIAEFSLALTNPRTHYRMSAGTWIELAAVALRTGGPALSDRADALIKELGISVEPVCLEQSRLARAAYREYGRGLGRRPSLNFGDCFAYGLAKLSGEPLLYKGNDFAHTDIRSALPR